MGDYRADFIVEGMILMELKAISCFTAAHLAQARHYLAATGFPIVVLLNFGAPALDHALLVDPGRTTRFSPAAQQ